MARAPVLAAGGIVIRGGARPLIAVVQRRKDDGWVLPKGKLKRKERAIAAARREVREETGHDVRVHEFLGVMSHRVAGRLKVVQFWKMEAAGGPPGKLMGDIKAVAWLPFRAAVKRLSLADEQAFLRSVRPRAVKPDARTARKQRRSVRMDRGARKLAASAHGRAAARAPSPRIVRFRQVVTSLWSEPAEDIAHPTPR